MNNLELLRADLAAARLPASRARVVLLALAAAVTITAAALAANHYLGQPAPAHVNATFAKLISDPRWPVKPVLRETAKVVAFSSHGVLYAAETKDGNDCLEFFTAGGATYWVYCGVGTQADYRLTFIPPMPFHGTRSTLPPYVVVGRIAPGNSLDARLPDGRTERVPLGLRGYFVFEPRYQAAARRGDLTLVYRKRSGVVSDTQRIPPQIVVNPSGAPIKRLTGYIAAPRARYASFVVAGPGGGTTTTGYAPIGRDGRFSWTVPPTRWRTWTLSILLVDARFMALNLDQDYWPIPDARFWKQARAEAARG